MTKKVNLRASKILCKQYIDSREAVTLINTITGGEGNQSVWVGDILDYAKSNSISSYVLSSSLGLNDRDYLALAYVEIISGQCNMELEAFSMNKFASDRIVKIPLECKENTKKLLFEYLDKDMNRVGWPHLTEERTDELEKETTVYFKPKEIQEMAYKIKEMELPSEDLIQKLQGTINKLSQENKSLLDELQWTRTYRPESAHNDDPEYIFKKEEKCTESAQSKKAELEEGVFSDAKQLIRQALLKNYSDGEEGFWNDIAEKAAEGDIFAATLLASHLYPSSKNNSII